MTLTIIGSGNVAKHLISAFSQSDDVTLLQVYTRKKEALYDWVSTAKITDNLEELEEADLYIIAVSDDAIIDVASQLPFKNRLVVHTSGSVPMESLPDDNRKGVFYPLQTFSQTKAVDFKSVPLCIESQYNDDYQFLKQAAEAISDQVFAINSDQRKALHVAAVFVNNFTNHLYKIGSDICQEHQVPFEILKPLIRETADKVIQLSPEEGQTGPAQRDDQKTIAAQLEFLTDDSQKNIYKLLTQSIQDHAQKL